MNKLAIVFPGQGSQSLGMLSDIAAEYSEVKQTFDQASSVLGYDLWKLVQEGPAESLDQTEHTQPALLTASYAVWNILKKIPLNPPFEKGGRGGNFSTFFSRWPQLR